MIRPCYFSQLDSHWNRGSAFGGKGGEGKEKREGGSQGPPSACYPLSTTTTYYYSLYIYHSYSSSPDRPKRMQRGGKGKEEKKRKSISMDQVATNPHFSSPIFQSHSYPHQASDKRTLYRKKRKEEKGKRERGRVCAPRRDSPF